MEWGMVPNAEWNVEWCQMWNGARLGMWEWGMGMGNGCQAGNGMGMGNGKEWGMWNGNVGMEWCQAVHLYIYVHLDAFAAGMGHGAAMHPP